MDDYFKKQIITYMGNKRKFIPILSNIIDSIKLELNKELVLADGFSGSGIVSRLFKTKSKQLWTNDIAGYSETLNTCYLSTPSFQEYNKIQNNIDRANTFAHENTIKCEKWIRKHWAPEGKIKKHHRAYYTEKNAKVIDRYRYFINTLPEKERPHILAPLLVEASIHNNTSGQFSAFYKDEHGIGKYGGKKEIDVSRITGSIRLPMPLFSPKECDVHVSRSDTNDWVKTLPDNIDLIYYDPPYNKHPYSIYFFMLDIINNWDTNQEIPDTNRGQPKNWTKSAYNSSKFAKKAFENLIQNTRATFILLSYNNGGIIPLNDFETILGKYGKIIKIPVEHKTYRKFQGIASYKRKKEQEDVKEFLWLLDCRHKK
jgi:adenine-specific DNA-methyltransferase